MNLIDKSGIYSLGGFSFQIRVFALNLLNLHSSEENVGFEVLDDVSVGMTPKAIDEVEGLCGVGSFDAFVQAIQVKKTKVTEEVAKRVLKNWISLSVSTEAISKYSLVTNQEDTDINVIKKVPCDDIYNDVCCANPRGKSIDSKLAKLSYSRDDFEKIISAIKEKSDVNIVKDIDSSIYEGYKDFFDYEAVAGITYETRLKQFLQEITYELLRAVDNGEAFKVDYRRLICLKEKYIQDVTNEKYNPSFSNFRRLNKADITALALTMSREYDQLKKCDGLSEYDIRENLLLNGFYSEYKRHFCDLGKREATDDIEITAYENFRDVRNELIAKKMDSPILRLTETKNRINTHAQSDQIRYGVCINLTGEHTPIELQISWKEEKNGRI